MQVCQRNGHRAQGTRRVGHIFGPIMSASRLVLGLVLAFDPLPAVAQSALPVHWVRQVGSGAVNNDPWVGECMTEAVAPNPSLGFSGVLIAGAINGNAPAIQQTSVFAQTQGTDLFVAALDDGGGVVWQSPQKCSTSALTRFRSNCEFSSSGELVAKSIDRRASSLLSQPLIKPKHNTLQTTTR